MPFRLTEKMPPLCAHVMTQAPIQRAEVHSVCVAGVVTMRYSARSMSHDVNRAAKEHCHD